MDLLTFCLSNAMHGQNINSPVCLSVCPSHFLSACLQVRPLNRFLHLIALNDTDLCKDVPLGGLDDE